MGQKGKEFRQEKSWGQSKISAFTFVRREAVIRVFPGQPQSVQSLGPLFFFFFFPSHLSGLPGPQHLLLSLGRPLMASQEFESPGELRKRQTDRWEEECGCV